MHEVERLALLAQLGEEFCELNHGPGTRREDFPASDYLVMPFGVQGKRSVRRCGAGAGGPGLP